MALFSRRPKKSDVEPAREVPAADLPTEATDAGSPASQGAGAGAAVPREAAASVGITVTSFQGLGSPTTAPEPSTAPSPSPSPGQAPIPPAAPAPAARPRVVETVPGLRDNVVLREKLATLPDDPEPPQLLDLARQALQGHLFLRVKGDAKALLAAGENLPLAVASIGDRRFALAYSSGAALAASIRSDGDTATSAMAQSAITVLRHVRDGGMEGLIIDPASAPARAILPRALIERMLTDVDEGLTVKTLLAQERTDATAAAVADAMTRVPLWVAVNAPQDGSAVGIAQGRAEDGSRYLEVYTHPLEVIAMGRGDRWAPVTAAQLAKALGGDVGLSGVIVDPQGPWIRLSRAELAPVLAAG